METKNTGGSLTVYRNEIKYFISQNEMEILRRLLSSFLNPDPYMLDSNGYTIRSLYFDSIDNRDYQEKMMGIEKRKKIRLRTYDVDSDFLKFEIKNRFNNYNLKESLLTDTALYREISKDNYEILKTVDNPVAEKLYNIMSKGIYKPKVIVEYEREAYINDLYNIRITFDKNIRASNNLSLLSKNLPFTPVSDENITILEVKFDNVLPEHIRKILSICDSSPSSYSKYCAAFDMYYI